jgi:acyl-homoserine lactone acylase PvdQ
MEPETRKLMKAYVAGINHFAKTNHILHTYIFWIPFDEWELVDNCSLMKLMHLFLNHNWGIEFIRDYIDAVTKDEYLGNR